METIFRKVNVKERLPAKEDIYFIIQDGSIDTSIYYSKGSGWIRHGITITHWLEELPVPEIIQEKDSEIERLKVHVKISNEDRDGFHQDANDLRRKITEKDKQIQEMMKEIQTSKLGVKKDYLI